MHSEYIKQLRGPVLILIISGAVAFIELNGVEFFGPLVNKIFPCVQDPQTSFPCWSGYDIGLVLGMVGLSIGSLLIIMKRMITIIRNT